MFTAYLTRIGLSAAVTCDISGLGELQSRHLQSVPFENLDVFHRRGVSTDVEHALEKIVGRARGGWCFEMNGAFGWLLAASGFDADYVSCRVMGDDGWGPELDHCGIVVHLDGRRWYTDVGFGDWSMTPIPLETGIHRTAPHDIACRIDGDRFVLAQHTTEGVWEDRLSGTFTPRALAEFDARSRHLQTAPGLRWTSGAFATMATGADGSRVTLRRGILRRRSGSDDFVDEVVPDAEWADNLHRHFGLHDALERGGA